MLYIKVMNLQRDNIHFPWARLNAQIFVSTVWFQKVIFINEYTVIWLIIRGAFFVSIVCVLCYKGILICEMNVERGVELNLSKLIKLWDLFILVLVGQLIVINDKTKSGNEKPFQQSCMYEANKR